MRHATSNPSTSPLHPRDASQVATAKWAKIGATFRRKRRCLIRSRTVACAHHVKRLLSTARRLCFDVSTPSLTSTYLDCRGPISTTLRAKPNLCQHAGVEAAAHSSVCSGRDKVHSGGMSRNAILPDSWRLSYRHRLLPMEDASSRTIRPSTRTSVSMNFYG